MSNLDEKLKQIQIRTRQKNVRQIYMSALQPFPSPLCSCEM